MTATIRDVARQAGVAVSTVSHIFNGTPLAGSFKAETRAKVEAAIRDLHYHPSARGRSLSKRRLETIGVALAVGSEDTGFPGLTRGSFYADLLDGIESVCFESTYLLMLTRIPAGSRKVPAFLLSQSVDGFIAVHELNAETRAAVQRTGIPLLTVNANPDRGIPGIRLDERWSVQMTLDRLCALGHRGIAYLGRMADDVHYSTRDRRLAYLHGMRARGLEPVMLNAAALRQAPDDLALEEQLRALQRRQVPVTALVFYGDVTARRVQRVLERMGLPPGRMSLAVAQLLPPQADDPGLLGGVEQDLHAVGQAAARELLAALAGQRAPRGRLVRGRWRDGVTVARRIG
jgi:DNA-binding LacI/PurR family transcriptional regulator